MGDVDEATPAKRRRISLSDAIDKSRELNSAQHAAEWAIDQYKIESKNKQEKAKLKKRFCSIFVLWPNLC